jgi:monoterpene epsilon-lactone hydrolase
VPSKAFEFIANAMRERNNQVLTLDERRAASEGAIDLMPPPDDVIFTDAHAGGVPAEWVEAPDASRERAILYLHGGAYVICSPRTHRRLTAALSREARARVLAIDYRLAPEHPFPAAVDDAVAAYKWLLERTASEHIAVAGDSAGGGLTLALLLRLRDERIPMPACAVLLSPWADLDTAYAAEGDIMLNAVRLKESADMYLAGADARSPLASPVFADLRGLPPMLIHAAAEEMLADDAVRVADRARHDGVQVTLDLVPEMFHVWHIFAGYVPESDEAVANVGQFLRSYV